MRINKVIRKVYILPLRLIIGLLPKPKPKLEGLKGEKMQTRTETEIEIVKYNAAELLKIILSVMTDEQIAKVKQILETIKEQQTTEKSYIK